MSPLRPATFAFWLTVLCTPFTQAAAPSSAAATLRTQMEEGKLTVPLAVSYQQVVLEQRSGSGWKPLSVQYPRSLNREQMRSISFTLPDGVAPEDFRVQGYRATKFPVRFLYGKRQFARPDVTLAGREARTMDRLQKVPVPEITPMAARRVEADLWEVIGSQLFFFNQYRGLQVLDLADPTNVLRTGILRLPAVGVEMTKLDPDGKLLALLGQSNGKDRPGEGVLFLMQVSDGVPALVSQIPLEGLPISCRQVGSQLYVLTVLPGGGSQPRTQLARLNVSVPETPKVVGRVTFSGGSPAFRVQNSRLLVEVREAGQKRLHEVDAEKTLPIPEESLSGLPLAGKIMGYQVEVVGQELRVQNTANADEPPVVMSLAWRTDRVLPAGDFLVQVEDGILEGGEKGDRPVQARLRITPVNEPDLLVEELLLGVGRVVGLTQKGERLYIAQWVASANDRQMLRTWALDLADPAAIVVLGTAEQDLRGIDSWDVALEAVQPLWASADTLVWYLPARHYPGLWWNSQMSVRASQPEVKDLLPASSPALVLCPVRFTKGLLTAPEPQILLIKGGVTATSRAFVEGGLVYCSYDTSDVPSSATISSQALIKVPFRPVPAQIRSWLQVVDFRSGGLVLREAVSIPGRLLSVAQADAQGAVLLTHSDLTLRHDGPSARLVHASAYDGVSAYHLDTYITATSFHSASTSAGVRLYFTRQNGAPGVVAVGYQAGTGRLSQISSWNTNAPPQVLHVAGGHLVASSHGNLELAGVALDSGRLTPVATYDTPAPLCLQVDRAAITPANDLWIPAGPYGVEFLQKQALGGE